MVKYEGYTKDMLRIIMLNAVVLDGVLAGLAHINS